MSTDVPGLVNVYITKHWVDTAAVGTLVYVGTIIPETRRVH